MSHPFNFFSNEYGSFSNNSPSTAGTDIEGNSSINQYILHEVIGEGSYGKVRMAFNQDMQTEVAIKIINKDDLKRKRQLIRDEKGRTKFKTAFDDLQKELSIMKQLDHPNIVKLYEIIEICDSSFVYIAMEHLKSGQILEWDDTNKQFYSTTFPGYIPENMLRDIFSGIISGLEYLHQHGIIHRDIKPQNILQDQYGTPKIVDFGSAIQLADSSRDILTTSEGSHAFMAPETNVENLSNKGYSGKAADIWAMGVTFFALTFNQLPFYNDDILELFKEVESKPLEFPQCRYVSFELRNMLEGLLEKDPKKRTKLEQLKENSWFAQNKSSYLVGDLSNKQGFLHPKDRIKKSNTLEEKSFNWGNLCNEDVKQLRRAKTSQFDKWGKPQKKVHRSSQ